MGSFEEQLDASISGFNSRLQKQRQQEEQRAAEEICMKERRLKIQPLLARIMRNDARLAAPRLAEVPADFESKELVLPKPQPQKRIFESQKAFRQREEQRALEMGEAERNRQVRDKLWVVTARLVRVRSVTYPHQESDDYETDFNVLCIDLKGEVEKYRATSYGKKSSIFLGDALDSVGSRTVVSDDELLPLELIPNIDEGVTAADAERLAPVQEWRGRILSIYDRKAATSPDKYYKIM